MDTDADLLLKQLPSVAPRSQPSSTQSEVELWHTGLRTDPQWVSPFVATPRLCYEGSNRQPGAVRVGQVGGIVGHKSFGPAGAAGCKPHTLHPGTTPTVANFLQQYPCELTRNHAGGLAFPNAKYSERAKPDSCCAVVQRLCFTSNKGVHQTLPVTEAALRAAGGLRIAVSYPVPVQRKLSQALSPVPYAGPQLTARQQLVADLDARIQVHQAQQPPGIPYGGDSSITKLRRLYEEAAHNYQVTGFHYSASLRAELHNLQGPFHVLIRGIPVGPATNPLTCAQARLAVTNWANSLQIQGLVFAASTQDFKQEVIGIAGDAPVRGYVIPATVEVLNPTDLVQFVTSAVIAPGALRQLIAQAGLAHNTRQYMSLHLTRQSLLFQLLS